MEKKVLEDLMKVMQIMIEREESKLRNMYMGEESSDYVRFIDSTARRDAINSIKSYLLGRLSTTKLKIKQEE